MAAPRTRAEADALLRELILAEEANAAQRMQTEEYTPPPPTYPVWRGDGAPTPIPLARGRFMKPLPPPPPPLQVSPEQQALIDAIEDDLWTRETAVSEYDGRTVMTGRAKPEWQMRGQDPPSVTRAVEAGEVALREDAARDAADADARTPREQAQKKRRFAGYPVERVTQELARRAAQARAAAAKAETEAAQESRAKGQRRTI